VRYWLHAEHLLVEGEKMSKSLGNFSRSADLFAKGYKPSALRFCSRQRSFTASQLNFTLRRVAAGGQLPWNGCGIFADR